MIKFSYGPDFIESSVEFYALRGDDFADMAKNNLVDQWEYNELKLFFNKCKTKQIIFDVGASIGIYSKLALLANSDNIVYSFEPNPFPRKALVRNVGNSKPNIKILDYALGSYNHGTYLLVPRDRPHTSSATLTDIRENNSRIWYKRIKVQCFTIDYLIKNHDIEIPNILKLDCEGSEIEILKGASELLQYHHPLIFFEALDMVELQDISLFLLRHGYVIRSNDAYSSRNFVAS
jgi:FkbM family methyltransferase